MSGSECSDDEDSGGGWDMTGVLFGNIDNAGRPLASDLLGHDACAQLSSLSRLGLQQQLRDMGVAPTEYSNGDGGAQDSDSGSADECREFAATAVDYSDITELADEEMRSVEDDAEDYDAQESAGDEAVSRRDAQLMPPPSSSANSASAASRRPLNTPLSAMLPAEYANVEITQLFPDFRQDKVLRFSRLFGPGKPSMLPQPWRNVRRRRRRKRRDDEDPTSSTPTAAEESSRELTLRFGPSLPPDQVESDDEEKLCRLDQPSATAGGQQKDHHQQDSCSSPSADRPPGSGSPKATDWRQGPSQLWYDMLDWPSGGDVWDYGFKSAAKKARIGGTGVGVVGGADGKHAEGNGHGQYDEYDDDLFPPMEAAVDHLTDPLTLTSTQHGVVADDVSAVGGKLSASSVSASGAGWKPAKIEDDAFLMVTQLNWEEDVIWNGDDIKHKVLQKLSSKSNVAGWLPSGFNRTAGQLSHVGKPFQAPIGGSGSTGRSRNAGADDERNGWFSMFPVENEELVYGRWEDDVIFDPDAMQTMPQPRILTLDPNDENIILGIPDDTDPNIGKGEPGEQRKIKIPHPHVRKSKVLLGKAGVITHMDEDTPPPTPEPTDKDPFNISNDEFYLAKAAENSIKIGSATGLLQHSIPVVELAAPFVPTHMGPIKLRQFHRPPLKRYSTGPLASTQPVPVQPLLKHIRRKAKQRDQERLMSGGGDVFFMRTVEDLTGKDGDVILVEYCEEHPPSLSLVGMCSKLKNYYKRRAGKDPGPPELPFGESAIAHSSPFLGIMQPGRCVQTVENNLYRAPIYSQKPADTDFLLIRTRQGYSIREMDALFVAGQQCPLYEVPGPNSKRANNFTRDFLQVFIYRLFWKSNDNPRRIKMEVIKRGFPHHSESSIRKRLKPCADFKRTGVDSNWWVIKPEFRLPTEDEIRNQVSPEQCCAHFSMVAAEQRLKDAGYGERFLLTQGDDDDADLKIDDEIKMAPWNTTRAYIQAAKGKCLLQMTGVGDPTGCGEGFSYIRVPNKPTLNKEEQNSQPKRIVTGTDADLRRLPLANAKALLKNFGVPDEEIKKLSRWEVIDVVRTLSTEKAKAGEEGMDRFSRGNRFSIAEHQERYKEECQRLFDLQNRVLASDEILSTDEGSSTEEENDDDIEEHGKNIENMLSNKKTSSQLTLEKEERERQELRKIMMGESSGSLQDDGGSGGNNSMAGRGLKKDKMRRGEEEEDTGQPRVLKITRTFCNADGGTYTRIETVRKPAVIEAYLRLRNTKDDVFIKQFAGQLDDVQKEEMKREKRRIQEQLRRIKRNQERERLGLTHQPRSRKPKLKPDLNIKCGACGQVGHMRTNKACPRYQGFGAGGGSGGGSVAVHQPSLGAILAETEDIDLTEQAVKLEMPDDEELINVDGTKIKLSGKVMKHAEELKRKSLLPGGSSAARMLRGDLRRRRRAGSEEHCDYLQQRQRTANRRRIDPLITFSTMLESILNEMRDMPDVQPFLFPVNVKTVPDYYNIVQRPMDLQGIRDNLRKKKYQSREDFLADVSQIVDNSSLYNGTKSVLTLTAQKMRHHLIDRFAEKEEKLMKLEKAINPLLDDDDQVGLSYILDRIVNERVKTMQESWPFLRPVSRKLVKDYYDVIKNPIDIETISKKVKGHKYHASREFVAEFELLLENCTTYNGQDSSYTQKAQALVTAVSSTVEKYADDLRALETNIAAAQQRAIENADMESLGTESALMDEDMGDDAASQRHLLADDLDFSDDCDGGVDVTGAIHSSASASAAGIDDIADADEPMLLELPPQVQQEDDGEDFDPSYDPSAFLYGLSGTSKETTTASASAGSRIHSDLQISDSEGEDDTEAVDITAQALGADEDDDDGLVF